MCNTIAFKVIVIQVNLYKVSVLNHKTTILKRQFLNDFSCEIISHVNLWIIELNYNYIICVFTVQWCISVLLSLRGTLVSKMWIIILMIIWIQPYSLSLFDEPQICWYVIANHAVCCSRISIITLWLSVYQGNGSRFPLASALREMKVKQRLLKALLWHCACASQYHR